MATETKTKTEQKQDAEVVKSIKSSIFRDVAIGVKIPIAGNMKSAEVGESDYGTYTRFNGTFRALVDGTVYMSSRLYVPEIAAEVLAAGLGQAENEFEKANPDLVVKGNDTADMATAKRKTWTRRFAGVDFKIVIQKVKDDSPIGYAWKLDTSAKVALTGDRYAAMLTA